MDLEMRLVQSTFVWRKRALLLSVDLGAVERELARGERLPVYSFLTTSSYEYRSRANKQSSYDRIEACYRTLLMRNDPDRVLCALEAIRSADLKVLLSNQCSDAEFAFKYLCTEDEMQGTRDADSNLAVEVDGWVFPAHAADGMVTNYHRVPFWLSVCELVSPRSWSIYTQLEIAISRDGVPLRTLRYAVNDLILTYQSQSKGDAKVLGQDTSFRGYQRSDSISL